MAAAFLLTACGPDAPPAPTWVTTHLARSTTATTVTNFVGAWTSEHWAATVEATNGTGTVPVGGVATVHFFPRSGAGNATLGSPQSLTPQISPGFVSLFGGDDIVSLGGTVAGTNAVEFFRRTGGTWGSAGTLTLPSDTQLSAATDRWIALRTVPIVSGQPTPVLVYSLDTTGPGVVATLAATLAPDPSWPANLQGGFGGQGMALDGDLLVVGAQGQFAPAPGGARVFRATGGVWAPVLSLGGASTGPNSYARYLAADDGASVDRIALGPQADSPVPAVVEVYADTGSGFVLEQIVTRDPADPDIASGSFFGNGIALDGDLLAVTSRAVKVPSSEVGHADVTVGYVQLFRRGTTWVREAEVPIFTNPAPADVTSTFPWRLQARGNHVAVAVLISPDPPPGCPFPCFNLGMESWSIDRTS